MPCWQKIFSSWWLKFPRKNYRQLYRKSKTNDWASSSMDTILKICQKNPLPSNVALVYHWFFSHNGQSTKMFSTSDSFTNTVISNLLAYLSRCRQKPWQGLLSFDFATLLYTDYGTAVLWGRIRYQFIVWWVQDGRSSRVVSLQVVWVFWSCSHTKQCRVAVWSLGSVRQFLKLSAEM